MLIRAIVATCLQMPCLACYSTAHLSAPYSPNLLTPFPRLQNMAATVRDIKAADFITKVLAIVSLRAMLSACFLSLNSYLFFAFLVHHL
jgi:hypothetical protein